MNWSKNDTACLISNILVEKPELNLLLQMVFINDFCRTEATYKELK